MSASSRRRTTTSKKRRRRFVRPARAVADPLEELGDPIAQRDFPRIAQMQVVPPTTPWSRGPAHTLKAARTSWATARRVVNILSFALKIQAAGVNRRLKQDIADQDPTLQLGRLETASLFEPEVSDQAFHAFEQYVKPNGR